MPRRSGVPKREIIADPIYNSTVVTKLINQVMKDGKRGTAQRICYDAFEIIKEKTGKDAIEVFDQAMENIMPVLEVKARRVGGATYQVPIEVRPGAAPDAGDPLAGVLLSEARRKNHAGTSFQRDHGRGE